MSATPACDLPEAHMHMPRRVSLLWALLGSLVLHLALLADPWLPEPWLEVARQVVAQRAGASPHELRQATQLLNMQEGGAVAAPVVVGAPSTGLQVGWHRPPPPRPEPVDTARIPDEPGGRDKSDKSDKPAARAVMAAEASARMTDVQPQVPEGSMGLDGQEEGGHEEEGMAEATQVVAAASPALSAGEGQEAVVQGGDQAGSDGPPHESQPEHRAQETPSEWQMPAHGRLGFSVSRGEAGFVVGRAQHRWQHDGQHYTLESITETTGLAALIRPSRVVWRSRGRIGSQGLQPENFVVEKNGREMDVANLDWTRMQLELSGRSQRALPLQPMTQDLLSMFYQLAHQLPEILRNREVMPVTNGRKLERYRFQLLGQEELQLKPLGKVMVVHVQVQAAEQVIDIWLAPSLAGLPVRIRYADGKGESFDQLLDELDVAAMPGVRPR